MAMRRLLGEGDCGGQVSRRHGMSLCMCCVEPASLWLSTAPPVMQPQGLGGPWPLPRPLTTLARRHAALASAQARVHAHMVGLAAGTANPRKNIQNRGARNFKRDERNMMIISHAQRRRTHS